MKKERERETEGAGEEEGEEQFEAVGGRERECFGYQICKLEKGIGCFGGGGFGGGYIG